MQKDYKCPHKKLYRNNDRQPYSHLARYTMISTDDESADSGKS